MREGGCLCGAVRYRVEGEPVASGICHCATCRRAASAPALPFAVFPAAALAFVAGAPATYRSSPPVTRTFCGRCGSPLTCRNAADAGSVDVMICSLDDPDSLVPSCHVWFGAKIGWNEVADDRPKYPRSRADGVG